MKKVVFFLFFLLVDFVGCFSLDIILLQIVDFGMVEVVFLGGDCILLQIVEGGIVEDFLGGDCILLQIVEGGIVEDFLGGDCILLQIVEGGIEVDGFFIWEFIFFRFGVVGILIVILGFFDFVFFVLNNLLYCGDGGIFFGSFV